MDGNHLVDVPLTIIVLLAGTHGSIAGNKMTEVKRIGICEGGRQLSPVTGKQVSLLMVPGFLQSDLYDDTTQLASSYGNAESFPVSLRFWQDVITMDCLLFLLTRLLLSPQVPRGRRSACDRDIHLLCTTSGETAVIVSQAGLPLLVYWRRLAPAGSLS